MLTLRTLHALSALQGAIGKSIRWETPSRTAVATAVLRGFVRDQDGNHMHSDDDVMSGYVRLSGVFESFVPVPDAVDAVLSGRWFLPA